MGFSLKTSATKTAIVGILLALTVSAVALVAEADNRAAADWPNWRGPTHDGVSNEKGWLTTWPKEGPKRLWTAEVGFGHAGVAVRAGKVYVMGRDGKQERRLLFQRRYGSDGLEALVSGRGVGLRTRAPRHAGG